MASDAQIEANRRNSEKSTGPKTQEGKLRVSQNAVSHGLRAANRLLYDEDAQEFDRLRAEIFADLEVEGPLEEQHAKQIVWNTWRLKRTRRAEAGRFIWYRFRRPWLDKLDSFCCDDDQYRNAVQAEVVRQYGLPKLEATQAEKDAHSALVATEITATIEKGLYGRAFNEKFHLDLTRYEMRLERQTRRLLADLEKRQAARKKRSSHDSKNPVAA